MLYLCISLFVTVFALTHFTGALNPGTSVSAFGVTVETSVMIGRIEQKLRVRHSSGVPLVIASSGSCLDSDFQSSARWYSLYPNVCDPVKQSQRWRLVDGVLRVGHKPESHAALEGDQACLTCWSQLVGCYLYVSGCTNTQAERYFLRIHSAQIDLVRGRIYFSIHSALFPDRCIAPYWAPSTSRTTNNYYLEDCQGTLTQSFYLESVNFNKEIDIIRTKVIDKLTDGVQKEFTTVAMGEDEQTSTVSYG